MVQLNDTHRFDAYAFRVVHGCPTYPRHQGHSFACWTETIRPTPGVGWYGQYRPEYKVSEDTLVRVHEEHHAKGSLALKVYLVTVQQDVLVRFRTAWPNMTFTQVTKTSVLCTSGGGTHGLVSDAAPPRNRSSSPASTDLLPLVQWLTHQSEVLWVDPHVGVHPRNTYMGKYIYGGDEAVVRPTANQVITIGDTGCDVRHCDFADADVEPAFNTLLLQPGIIPSGLTFSPLHRKILSYVRFDFSLDDENSIVTDFEDFEDGHGSHVMGTAVAEGPEGLYDGVAASAKLLVLDFGYAEGTASYLYLPQDLETHLFQWIMRDTESRIFSVSWGANVNMYGDVARQMDRFMWEHDSFIIITAVGNTGTEGLGSVGSPATAKNTISVGSTFQLYEAFQNAFNTTEVWIDEEFPPYDLPPLQSHPSLYNVTGLAYFSSMGPTSDGRIKPDILLPGSPVVSSRGGTACGHMVRHGTSMSAPAAAAIVATLRDAIGNPSSALVKAILVHWATPVSYRIGYQMSKEGLWYGSLQATVLQETPALEAQGFGRTRWRDTLPWHVDRHTVDADTAHVYCSSSGGRATLAWIDPIAPYGAAWQLQRNLDLFGIDATGTVHYSNQRSSPDYRNNVEQMDLPQGEPTLWVVTGDPLTNTAYALTLDHTPSEACGDYGVVELLCRVNAGWGTRTLNTANGKLTPCLATDCDDPYIIRDGECVYEATCDNTACPVPHGTGRACAGLCEVSRCDTNYQLIHGECVCVRDAACRGIYGGRGTAQCLGGELRHCRIQHCHGNLVVSNNECVTPSPYNPTLTFVLFILLGATCFGFCSLARRTPVPLPQTRNTWTRPTTIHRLRAETKGSHTSHD